MKTVVRLLGFAFGMFFSINNYAQNTNAAIDSINKIAGSNAAAKNYDTTFKKVEKEAEFPGGIEKWQKFIIKNLNTKVPGKNNAPVGTYKVLVIFTIDKEGNVSNAYVEKDPGYGMGDEAIRVIKKSPKWIPAEQDGKILYSRKMQPIVFSVSEK